MKNNVHWKFKILKFYRKYYLEFIKYKSQHHFNFMANMSIDMKRWNENMIFLFTQKNYALKLVTNLSLLNKFQATVKCNLVPMNNF